MGFLKWISSRERFLYSIQTNSVVVVLQGELTVYESPVVRLIGYDGHIKQRQLGVSSVYLNGVRKLYHTLFKC